LDAMSFDVEIGWVCERGNAERNEDFAAALRDARKSGLVAAIADGVSAGGLGLMAAQTTVRSVVDEFFGAPDTWETTVVLDRLIGAQNSWLADHNRRAGSRGGSGATTLTALALQGHGWTLAHIGDTRAWLLRGGELALLTTDHARQHLDFSAQLTRAVGLDDQPASGHGRQRPDSPVRTRMRRHSSQRSTSSSAAARGRGSFICTLRTRAASRAISSPSRSAPAVRKPCWARRPGWPSTY